MNKSNVNKEYLDNIGKDIPELTAMLKRISDESISKMALLTLNRGSHLYNKYEKDQNSIFLVMYGVCKIIGAQDSAGGPLYFSRGNVVGTYEALQTKHIPRTANVVAFTDTVLLEIPKEILQYDIYFNHKELFFWIVTNTIKKFHTNNNLSNTVRGDAIVKVSSYLIDIYRMCSSSTNGKIKKIFINDNQETIATNLRMSVRSVTRTVNTMKSLNLINLRKGKIEVNEDHFEKLETYVFNHGD